MHIYLLNCLTNSFKFLYNQYKKKGQQISSGPSYASYFV